MLERSRKQFLEANLELVRRGLVLYTFSKVSSISRELGSVYQAEPITTGTRATRNQGGL